MKTGVSPAAVVILQLYTQGMYINIHTHSAPGNGVWALQNRRESETLESAAGLYSMGIHPWYTDPVHWENQLDTLRRHSQDPRVLAIGETGLDKACSTPFPLQQQLFAAQVEWANSQGKPLVIHCVRAWDDVLSQLENAQNKVPVIFHGFAKNRQLAQRIIKAGHYISLGKALQFARVQEVLAALPADRIFLETDDAYDMGIETIYNLAATALSIDHNSLVLQIQKNAETVLGTGILL